MTTKSKNLRDVDRAMIHTVMFQLGILPMEQTNLDMRRALNQLTPEEAREARRKFRKIWRKAMRAEVGNGPRTKSAKTDQIKNKLGVGKHVPSRAERNARKELVYEALWKDVIEPMIKKFENPDGNVPTGKRKKP